MSKKKRSKIMAALLCATTMAAFYTAPQVVFAESLNVDDNGALTTNTNGTKPITNVTGLASITFGVDGEGVTESSVTLAFDVNKQGLYADGAITADDLYLNVADNYAERYTLKNVLGVHRVQDEDGYIYGKNDLFSLVIILKVMLSKDNFDEMITEISKEVENLDKVVNTVPLATILNRIGFPDNWLEIKDLS